MTSRKICTVLLVISTLLIIFMMLLSFSACSTSSNSNSKDGKSNELPYNNNGSGESGGTDGGQSEFVPAKADYENDTFNMLGFNGYGVGWRAIEYSDISAETINSDPINDAIFNRNSKVEELYNVKIKEVLHGDATSGFNAIDTTIRLMTAGDNSFDAGLSPGDAMPKIIGERNMTYNLLAIPELDLSKSWWNQDCVDAFTLGGKLHSVTGDISLWNVMATMVFYFNKKLIEDVGLESPYDFVKSGDWTWDKLAEMAKDATRDTTGDGKIDRFDQIGIASETDTMLQAVLCSGEKLTYKDSDGLPVINTNLERINMVIDKAMPILRSDEYAYATSDLYGRYPNPFFDFTLPKFRDNTTLFYTQQLMVALDLREMEADFGILPYPKFNKEQTDYYSYAEEYFVKYVWIPHTNPDPGKAATIIQAMGYYGQQMVIPALYEVTITNKALRDVESKEMLELINSSRVFELAYIYKWGEILNIYFDIYNKKTNNLASQYESKRDKIESAIQVTIGELY